MNYLQLVHITINVHWRIEGWQIDGTTFCGCIDNGKGHKGVPIYKPYGHTCKPYGYICKTYGIIYRPYGHTWTHSNQTNYAMNMDMP